MEQKTLEKTLDMAGSIAKVAANLSETKKPTNDIPKPTKLTDDNSNKASQNIQIALDTGKKKEPKPVEKHIHEFPEARPLTSEECELALKRAQMDYELKKCDQVFSQNAYNREWAHRMEVEKKNERKGKIRRAVGYILVALGVGTVGYSVWNDYRNHKPATEAPKALPEASNIKAEGEVK